MAVGSTPVRDLVDQLREKGKEVYTIGDAKAPRQLIDAIREGFEVAWRL